MPKVYMTCGKICVGKSTYAEELRKKYNGVILSVDEITLCIFGQDAGENHDLYVERIENYLYQKSLELVKSGVNVILDWGFWQKDERNFARDFYRKNAVDFEFHYIQISDEEWKSRLEKRNGEVLSGKTNAYYVDEGLAKKVEDLFEKPLSSETDLIIVKQQEV
ncbi:MAG: ATP-binding protein [Ruminococcus sp.]|nr:ATP-binding protein [Ruminococcus sp.]